MNRILASLTMSMAILSAAACDRKDDPVVPEQTQEDPDNNQEEDTGNQPEITMSIKITAGGKSFSATIDDTETGKAFRNLLPLTLEMADLNGNEKYCYGYSLPRNDTRFNSLEAGDLMLYSGNCIVLFYGNAGGYSYTRIGKIACPAGLAEALGESVVSVIFEK